MEFTYVISLHDFDEDQNHDEEIYTLQDFHETITKHFKLVLFLNLI